MRNDDDRDLIGGSFEVEAFSGRERSQGPRHARSSRDRVEKREPAEILTQVNSLVLKDFTRKSFKPKDLAGITS